MECANIKYWATGDSYGLDGVTYVCRHCHKTFKNTSVGVVPTGYIINKKFSIGNKRLCIVYPNNVCKCKSESGIELAWINEPKDVKNLDMYMFTVPLQLAMKQHVVKALYEYKKSIYDDRFREDNYGDTNE